MRDSHPAPVYRNELAESLATLVNMWWAPSFQGRLVEASGVAVGVTEARLLWELSFRTTARPSELAQAIELGAPSVTKAIARLRERGLVEQTESTVDRRVREVTLTESGRAATQRLYGVGDDLIGEIVAGWEPRKLREFTEAMRTFVDRAAAYGGGRSGS